MLKKIRVILAALFLIGITLLFIGIGHNWWGWMAKLQFLPSLLALNLTVIIGVVLLTLLVGRIYCSVICPMGVFQDLIIWIHRKTSKLFTKKSLKFKYVGVHKWVRYGVLVLSIVSIIASGQMLIALIAPYSAYGRMVRSVAAMGSDTMTPALIITGLLTLVIICICAWLWGREYCNTVCPVGTTLSLLSRFSLLRPVIDESKCINCAKCARGCKSGCIDFKAPRID